MLPGLNGVRMRLARRTVVNARVQAFTKLEGPRGEAFIGGPVLEGPADSRLRHCSHEGLPNDGINPNAEYPGLLEGEWNYVGPVHHHFGHVMAEMVHRILPSMQMFKWGNWLAVTGPGAGTMFVDLPPAYRAAVGFLGVGEA